MSSIRPRFTEKEFEYHTLKKLYDKKLYKVLLFSDPHGWLADLAALRCINQILQHNKFDEVVCNGDILDLPYISRHTSKLYEDGILAGYSEIKEVEYTREQILAPLRASTDAKIRIRVGNHDERITKPANIQQSQLAKLAVLFKHYQTTCLDTMLGLKETEGYIYDPSDVYTFFDKFDVAHGLSLAKNASEKNIQEYMSSGATGHTHRLNSKYLTNRKAPYVWLELGCTRIIQQVEYLPTGKIADWQNGFATVYFYIEDNKVRFYAQPHIIIEGRCYFNGVVYDGSYKATA
jgi:predicted phosphodiesterase